jgi:protein-S-isoprenylcysteine O-methyltransferase Ste14
MIKPELPATLVPFAHLQFRLREMRMSIQQTSIDSGANHSNGKVVRKSDSPGIIVLPPLLTLGTFLFAVALHLAWPLRLGAPVWLRISGALLVLGAVVLAVWGRRTMLRDGTNVNPYKPSLSIVTNGPFQFTRNPLYLSNVVAYLGLTFILNTIWPLILLVPMVLVFNRGIIQREERYLEAKFGDAYLAYKARVRRWL